MVVKFIRHQNKFDVSCITVSNIDFIVYVSNW